jgi:5,10-methylenetetrahydromethanopterin reductase
VADYIRAYRGLLRGETVEWEGARMRMLHPPGHAAPRPVDVPVLIGAQGPKGQAVAAELADGLFTVAAVPDFAKEFSWVPHLCWGTVFDDGDEPESERVRAAGGPGTVVAIHGVYEYNGPVAEMPGGAAWLEEIERVPEAERHLVVHSQHCVGLNAADEAAWAGGAHALLKAVTVSGTRDEVRARVAALAEQGATEIVYQPAGPDIRRELETFIEAAS